MKTSISVFFCFGHICEWRFCIFSGQLVTAFTTIIVKVCAFIFMWSFWYFRMQFADSFKLSIRAYQFFPTFLPMFAVLHGVIPLWVPEDLINRIIHMNAGTKGKCFFFTVFSSQTVLNLLVRICLVFTYFSMVHFFFVCFFPSFVFHLTR